MSAGDTQIGLADLRLLWVVRVKPDDLRERRRCMRELLEWRYGGLNRRNARICLREDDEEMCLDISTER